MLDLKDMGIEEHKIKRDCSEGVSSRLRRFASRNDNSFLIALQSERALTRTLGVPTEQALTRTREIS